MSQATYSLSKDEELSVSDKGTYYLYFLSCSFLCMSLVSNALSHMQIQDNHSMKHNVSGKATIYNNKHETAENATAVTDLLFNAEPPPELEAETILDSEHRQILAKLRFVLELIETLISVAEKKTNLMAMIMDGGARKSVI